MMHINGIIIIMSEQLMIVRAVGLSSWCELFLIKTQRMIIALNYLVEHITHNLSRHLNKVGHSRIGYRFPACSKGK